jgi:hypothetical protein
VKAWTARAVPYAAVTPAAKSAHGLRLRVANLEAALERAERERDHFRDAWAEAQVRLDCGADATEAVREERAAVVAWLRALAVECRGEGLVPEDYALCEAAHDIAAGRHRPGGDP